MKELLDARAKTHGDWKDFCKVSQKLKNICLCHNDKDLAVEKVEALEMICHKIARIVVGDDNHKDHWDDIAGYATRGAESCISPEERMKQFGQCVKVPLND